MSRALFAALLFVAGCHYDLNDPGTEPVPAQFYFPAGVAMDPGGRFLYVSNGNADLRYGGGAVQLVDTLRFECAVRAFRAQTAGQPSQLGPECGTSDDIAAAMAAVPSCQVDPIDPSVVDCDETPFIKANQTVKVGNFAGVVRLRKTGDNTRTLFVAVRGDPSVTRIDVDLTHDLERPGALNCFDHPETLTARPGYQASTNTTVAPPGCDVSHLVQTYTCAGLPSCVMTTNQIPPEPFAVQFDDGVTAQGAAYARLVVSHLAGGEVMVINPDASDPTQAVQYVSSGFFTADPSGRHGAFALAPQFPHHPSSPWYLTSDIQPTIATFRIADANVVVPSVAFPISGAFNSGSDVRDIVFEPGGNRAFLTENNPPSLVVLDTRTLSTGTLPGVPANQVVDIVDVCQAPSHMGVRRTLRADAGGAPSEQTRIYVVCFLSNQVMVVDPDRAGVDDTILVGRGPNDIAFNFASDGDSAIDAPPRERRGYVTNFTESSISVLDLEPGSASEDRLVARIGLPQPPPPM
jgi:YVTN family beta-propeller protein